MITYNTCFSLKRSPNFVVITKTHFLLGYKINHMASMRIYADISDKVLLKILVLNIVFVHLATLSAERLKIVKDYT